MLDQAIKLDPNYEPALLNREIVLALEEGECLKKDIKIVAKIGATWTPITEILGHLCQFYLDTKNGSHLDTFFATPINQFHLS